MVEQANRCLAGEGSDALAGVPANYREALRRMVNRQYLASENHKAQHWRANRKGADERILEFERAFVRRFAQLGVPMWAHCVTRSAQEQAKLFQKGNSKAGAGKSPHNYGMAVDLVHGVYAWEIPKPCWDLVGHIGKEVAASIGVKVEWGGDWSFYDPAHWELKGWKDSRKVAVLTLDGEPDRLFEFYSGRTDTV